MPTLTGELKKYLGLPPYDGGSNIVRYDSYFLDSIYKRFPKERVEAVMAELRKEVPHD